jgi:DNA-binding Lrp family transcriptional regulator
MEPIWRMNIPASLDEHERRILAALQQDGRLSMQELAEKVGLSVSPTWRRVRALEERGVIQRYAALLDPERIGLPECVVAQVTLDRQLRADALAFERVMLARPEVLECFAMTGDADYMIRVAIRDTRSYERFLQEAIFSLPFVRNVRSSFALRTVKLTTALPV